MSIKRPIGPPINPALIKHAEVRAQSVQNRIADAITMFAGSMAFVYIHIIWFSAWIGFGVEHYPFSQNRADAKRQVLADHQWTIVQEEETQNEDLLDISKRILELTQAIHALTTKATSPPGSPAA